MKEAELSSPAAIAAQRTRMEAVWRDRAHRLSQRPNLAGAGQNELPVVVLGLGQERYGIELQDVAEVFPPVLPTPVPGAAPLFSGVINVHGEIRPVVDLRRVLQMEPSVETNNGTVRNRDLARVILLRKGGREMGLQIDSVEQIRWVAPADIQSAIASEPSQYITGSTKDLLRLLSTRALFAELDGA